MTNYQLDTNICIFALKRNAQVLDRLLSNPPTSVWISVVTEAELRTGAAKSASPAKTLRLVENFLRPLQIVEFTSADAAVHARLRAKLERAGTPIGPLDTLIAAHALARRLTLVTNNTREFGRVPDLPLEDWSQ